MKSQKTFADIEFESRKRKTKREEFLEMMDKLIPWDEWLSIIKPHYPDGKRGRPTRGIETCCIRSQRTRQFFFGFSCHFSSLNLQLIHQNLIAENYVGCIMIKKQFLFHITNTASPLAERFCGICAKE